MKPLLLSFFVFISSYSSSQVFSEYAIPTRAIAGNICASPDNRYIYFTANMTIGRADMAGNITEFKVPEAGPSAMNLVGCSFNPDGTLYFADQSNYVVYAFAPATRVFTKFTIPYPASGIAGLQFHSDGLLYLMVSGSSAIHRMQPDGKFLPAIFLAASRYPHGPSSCNGNVWFVENTGNRVASVAPDGSVSEFLLPDPGSAPFSTACAPDGGVYFTLSNVNKIGRIDTATFAITTWKIPTWNSIPKGISSSATGVCFGESNVNKIGCMPFLGGTMTEAVVAYRGTRPNKLVYGPDGGIWFSQSAIAYIARWR